MVQQRVILITGASAGIGRASAVALSNAYPSSSHPEPLVLCLAGRREAELQETAKRCREGTTVEICAGSTSSDEDVARWFKTVREKYGRLDVLFNVSLWIGSAAEIGAHCRTPGWICCLVCHSSMPT